MNQVAIQQNTFSSPEEMRVSVVDRRDQLVCPKPRRLGLINATINDHPCRPPPKWHHSHQELCDSIASNDALDLLFFKGSCGSENFNSSNVLELASPPPFLFGSPPTRVANPLVQDVRFGDGKPKPKPPLFSPVTPPPAQLLSPPPSSSGRKGGCVRANFGNNPVVRIEGFDCDRRNRSIPALA